MCGRALLQPRDLAPGCDEGAMVVPTSLFSTAAQNADPSHHRYLDRCTHRTPFVSMSCRIGGHLRSGRAVRAAGGNRPATGGGDAPPRGEPGRLRTTTSDADLCDLVG